MIVEQRNLDTTYRISREDAEGVKLTIYPPNPLPVTEGWYRMDQLPQWMIGAMALLDAASPGVVGGIGQRISEITYWIEPPPKDTAGDRIAAFLRRPDPNRNGALIAKVGDGVRCNEGQ